jgi:hypothetical protein
MMMDSSRLLQEDDLPKVIGCSAIRRENFMSIDTVEVELVQYEDKYGEVEEWKLRTKEVELCNKVDEALEAGLKALAHIDRTNNSWLEEVRSKPEAFRWHKAAKIARRYLWWLSLSELVIGIIELCEAAGYTIDEASSFRDAYNRVALMSLDIEAAKKAIAA